MLPKLNMALGLLLLPTQLVFASGDALHVAPTEPVVVPEGAGYEARKINNPAVAYASGIFYLYYSGQGYTNAIQTGLATSIDGFSYTKNPDNPVYWCAENTTSACRSDQAGLSWSAYRVAPVGVMYEDGVFRLWYSGSNVNVGQQNYLGFATSTDGFSWEAYASNPVFPVEDIPAVEYLSLVKFDGQYLLYYKHSSNEVWLATSEDGISWNEVAMHRQVSHLVDSVSVLEGVFVARQGGRFGVSANGVDFQFNNESETNYIDAGMRSDMLVVDDVLHIWWAMRTDTQNPSVYHATSTLASVLGDLWDGGDEEPGENTAPSIELVGSSTVYVERGSAWVEPGYVASDAQDEEGDLTIDVDGDVDIDVEGAYVLVYTVTDTGGLAASTSRTVVVEPRKARAVAFLPGITGSRLYSGPDAAQGGVHSQFWESTLWFEVDELGFDDNAQSERSDILASGVVDRIRPFTGLFSYGEAYAEWLEQLALMQDVGDISGFAVLPYDWRLAIPNLAKNGVVNEDAMLPQDAVNYIEEGEESYLISELRELAAESPSGKVVVVAHSMGGLLAKYLLTTLAPDDPLLDAIETVVFVGTPHLGTPKTLGELLHGSVPMAKIASREVTEDMPGPYQLIPSAAYFAAAETPAGVFEESVARDIHLDGYAGSEIDEADALLSFLRGGDGAWNEPAAFALARPNVLSDYLLTYAGGLHAVLDSWEAPEGMRVLNVVGWNRMTPSAIRYAMTCKPADCAKDLYFLEHTYDLSASGDGTVFGVSGEGTDAGETWYVHTDKINERDDTNRGHGTLLSMEDVFGVAHNAALGNEIVANEMRTSERPSETPQWANVVVHSPLDVHIYEGGKHTGITGPGGEDEMGRPYEEEVTNSYYFEWGEVKYAGVIVPESGVTFTFDGTDEGWFTLDVTVPDGDATQTYVWPDVAVLPESEGTMRVAPGQEPVLVYDYDGDGEADAELAPGETFAPWMLYAVSFAGLREAIRDAGMPSYAERHALSRVYASQRYAYRSRTVYRAINDLERLAAYVRMQVGYGRVDEHRGETVAVLAEKVAATLR